MTSSDPEFVAAADTLLRNLQAWLDTFDPDELEADCSGGVLKITFADRRACILNRQAAARQIWLAEGTSAWHFELDANGQWLDTKGKGLLGDVLGDVLSRRLGRTIKT